MRVRTRTVFAIVAGAGILGSAPISADAAPQVRSVPLMLLQTSARKREHYVSRAMSRFRRYAGRDRILTEADVVLHGKIAAAKQRARRLKRYLSYDLDGDLTISEAERDTHLQAASTRYEEDRILKLTLLDRDGDGNISVREIIASQDPRRKARADRAVAGLRDLLAIDPDGDGRLTVKEFARYAEAVFDSWDKNGDWELDQVELQAVRTLRRELHRRPWRR